MKIGPNDLKIEIDEVGIEETLEGILPGSEVSTSEPVQAPREENETSGIDDPFGW